MKRVVIDTETNALRQYTACHVVVCRDVDTDEVATFRHIHLKENRDELRDYLGKVDLLIGHNIIGFDLGVLRTFGCPYTGQVLDTLIVSRLLNYNQEGGHSLENWGSKFKFPKSLFNDFSKWSQELEDRCIIDTLLTKRLYNYLLVYIQKDRWKASIELEHKAATRCITLSSNGFTFNYPLSLSLREELELKVSSLREELQVAFPPVTTLVREVTPVATKAGTLHSKDFRWLETKDLSPFSVGSTFSLFEYVPFNPGSPTQVVARLNAAGWKPYEKTKGHIQAERDQDVEALKYYREFGWKVCEENLDTLPEDAPEAARKLAEYLLLSNRLSTIKQWIDLYNEQTGRIHGTFNSIGSWTHRKSHIAPNMANVPALHNRKGRPQPYGPEFRSLWTASRGRVLVGTDAEGIQLRIFAHLCNDQKLIEAIVNGKKEEGTDIHTLNKRTLGIICNSREAAKTYIYALLLGAGMYKQAQILQCTPPEALDGLKRILDFYPGWKELKNTRLRKEGQKGYFEGLDGRLVMCPSPHHVLAGHLQNGESVVMKLACELWHDVLSRMRIPFMQVNDVHDEWQTETLPEFADIVGRVQADSIRMIGEQLKLNCPLAGSYKIGNNWKETH
jgi:DNA polymerase-1